jgi:hypothetical protein
MPIFHEAVLSLSFEPWFPVGEGVTTLTARCQQAFMPDRLLVSSEGGFFEVALERVTDDEPRPPPQIEWMPADLFNVAGVGPNVEIGPCRSQDAICLHVRFTRPLRQKSSWWRRLFWWRQPQKPWLLALLMGRAEVPAFEIPDEE